MATLEKSPGRYIQLNRKKKTTHPRRRHVRWSHMFLKVRGILILLLLSHGWSLRTPVLAVRRRATLGTARTLRAARLCPSSDAPREEQAGLENQALELDQCRGI